MGICAPQSKIPGKPVNKGFPGIVNYSYSMIDLWLVQYMVVFVTKNTRYIHIIPAILFYLVFLGQKLVGYPVYSYRNLLHEFNFLRHTEGRIVAYPVHFLTDTDRDISK